MISRGSGCGSDAPMLRTWIVLVLSAEATAKLVLAVSLPKMGTLIELDSIRRAELQLMRAATAVKLYAHEHGRLPDAPSDLVPQYVAELPADPFAQEGEAVRWLRKQAEWRVYSLGPDRRDQNGQQEHDPAAAEEGGRSGPGRSRSRTLAGTHHQNRPRASQMPCSERLAPKPSSTARRGADSGGFDTTRSLHGICGALGRFW